MKTLGWVLTVWGVYAGISMYLSEDYTLSAIAFFMTVTIMILNIGNGRQGKAYTALLCVRDEDTVHQFIIGIATNLASAGVLVKLEAIARQTRQVNNSDFTVADDYYVVQQRQMDSTSVLQEFNFTKNGDFISE